MENELIEFKITKGKNGNDLVSARELHEKLGLSKRFSAWIEQYIKENNDYLFENGVDFVECTFEYGANQYGAIGKLQDYAITFDMAKEICMVTKNSKGKKCRKWFIEKEKELKSLQEENQPKLPTTYKEALQQLLAQVEENEKLLEENNKISLENQILNGEHFSWVDKSLINAIVRKYGACLGDFSKAWVEFKKNLLYKYSININSRKTLALNNGKPKSKCKTLDMLHGEDEIQKSIMVALSMCNEKDIDVSDILKHAKEEYEKEN